MFAAAKDPMGVPEKDPGAFKDSGPFKLEGMGETALLELRAKIDAVLPVTSLGQMNLQTEMVLQYRQIQHLQTEIIASDEVEANKKAQVVNACNAALESLVKMQDKHHTAERLKEIEGRLIDCLNRLPKEATAKFFEWYEESLRG